MENHGFFRRLTLLTGIEAAAALEKCRVIVFGLGGVGSWCAEALVRSGIGSISLVDYDTVAASNVNRQIQASCSTIGRLKTEALEERLKDINPSCEIKTFPYVFSKEGAELYAISKADYIIDAIDTLTQKLDLIETALEAGKTIFSSMGMAQKLDPTLNKTADIWDTRGCPLARLVRQGLRKRNISGHFTAVYSPERLPRYTDSLPEEQDSANRASGETEPEHLALSIQGKAVPLCKKAINGSAVTVTATAGMVLASLVIRDLCARIDSSGTLCRPGGPDE